MFKKDKLTPEEKLLKLIEGKGIDKNPQPKKGRLKTQGRSTAFDLISKFSKFKNWLKFFIDTYILKRRVIRWSLVLIVLTLVFMVIIEASWQKKTIEEMVVTVLRAGKLARGVQENVETIEQIKDLPEYLNIIGKRNIFIVPGNEVLKKIEEEKKIEPTNLIYIVKDFKLVGIIGGSAPQAIIEDTKEQKTYFLTEGQVFGNMITVKKVLKNSVILSKDEEELEFF
ncbi:MAG: hypothetical protein ABH952_10580 [Candidatus Omnitrophota bacterium]